MHRLPRRVLAVAFVIGTCAFAGPIRAADEQAARATTIKIENFRFVPAELKIVRGTKVTWVNDDDVPHVVRSTDATIKSSALDTDDTFSYDFEQAGTYHYFCSLHPKMTGTIVVE